MMDSKDNFDRNNPINNWEERELCNHCQYDLVNESGEMVCEACDKCDCCGEMLNECDCTDD